MTDKCKKHGVALECMAGRSAHPSNWYCPECDKHQAMNRQQAIEQVARDVVDEAFYLSHDTHRVHELHYALAMPDDTPPTLKYFWSGPSGHFYTDTLDRGELIVKHLPDGDDYTATELVTPKNTAERDGVPSIDVQD